MKNTLTLLSLGICALLSPACKKREISPPQKDRSVATIELYGKNPFRNMPKLNLPDINNSYIENEGLRLSSLSFKGPCKTEIVTKTVAFDEQILLAPGADVIYLGSVIDAKSLISGAYKPIVPIKKRPIQLSLSLQGVQGMVSNLVTPTLHDTRQAINSILNQTTTGDQPTEITYGVSQIHSEDQLKLALGVNFSLSKLAEIKSSFNFNDTDQKTRVVAKILQKYYTVDMNIPDDGIFVEERPDPEKFGPYSPVYISSLTFGRMGLFFMESTYPVQELSTAIDVTLTDIKQPIGNVGTGITLACKEILNTSTIKVFTTGGSGEAAVEAIRGYDGFVNFIKSGGKFGVNSRGAILSYQLRNLSDYTIFQTKLTSTYEVKTCLPTVGFDEGRFVKNDDTNDIFIFMDSRLRKVPRSLLGTIFHYNESKALHVNNESLLFVPRSEPFSKDTELVKHFFSQRMYLREDKSLRLIVTPQACRKYHFNIDNTTLRFCLKTSDLGSEIE